MTDGGWGVEGGEKKKQLKKRKKTFHDENVKIVLLFIFPLRQLLHHVRLDQHLFVHPTHVENLFFLYDLFSTNTKSKSHFYLFVNVKLLACESN